MIASPPSSFKDGGGLPIGTVFMKHVVKSGNRRNGFTLVELIVTIMVAAILGVMFVQVMGTSLTGSVEPLIRTQHMFEINGVMEKITAEYKQDTTPLDTLKTQIGSKDEVVKDGTYGSYKVVYNDYITFNESGGQVSESGDRILKITIADVNGEQNLTALFTK